MAYNHLQLALQKPFKSNIFAQNKMTKNTVDLFSAIIFELDILIKVGRS